MLETWNQSFKQELDQYDILIYRNYSNYSNYRTISNCIYQTMIYTIVTRSVELYPTISIIFNQTYCYRIFANWPLIWPKKKNIEKMAPPRNRLRQRHGPPREEIDGDFDGGKPMEAPKTRGIVVWNFLFKVCQWIPSCFITAIAGSWLGTPWSHRVNSGPRSTRSTSPWPSQRVSSSTFPKFTMDALSWGDEAKKNPSFRGEVKSFCAMEKRSHHKLRLL